MQKITIDSANGLANQHQKDDFNKLFDGDTSTIYTAWNPAVKPYSITFPLFNYSKVIISQIKIYINNGNPSTQKYYYIKRDTGEKILFLSFPGGSWSADPSFNPLRTFDVPAALQADAKAFIIESNGGDDFPANLELWGDVIAGTITLPSIARSPLSQLMGVVCKPWDVANNMFPEKQPLLKEMGVSRVRLYADYILLYNTTTKSLDVSAGMWKMFDNIKLLKSKGIETQLCYHAVPYLPYPLAQHENVETYLQLAKDLTFLAQANKDNGDPVKWIEVLNEEDAWYAPNPDAHMTGYAIAALMSMCYDGHKGNYPVGIKGTGTTALVSVGGLAEAEPFIFYQMAEWFEKNRGRKSDGSIDFGFDVYSYHLYSSLEGQRQGVPGGTPPEIGMVQYMKKANIARKITNPKIKVHIGEWGWDINSGSSLNAPAFGKYSAHQTSAMWTARALLAMAENEVDANSYFRIKQDYDPQSDANPTAFETMALTRQESAGTKQPDGSYIGFGLHRTMTGDYFKQLSEFFNHDFVFDTRLSDSPNVVKFKKDTTELYVVWESEAISQTGTNRPVFSERTGNYSLNVKGKLRRFVDDGSGVLSTEDFAGGSIAFDSKPVFVVVDSSVVTPPPPPPAPAPVIVDKGYYTDKLTLKRVYWVMYDNKTWMVTNSKYQPI